MTVPGSTARRHSTDKRGALIRLIHVAKRDLGLDEDTYRAALVEVTGKASAAAMSVADLDRVLSHFKRKGFMVRQRGKVASRPQADTPEARKIRALWSFLHQIGAVRNASDAALTGYVKRMTGVDALQWVNDRQATRLIETLKMWAMRFLPDAVSALVPKVNAIDLPEIEKITLGQALSKAFAHRTFDPMWVAWEALNDVLKEARHGRSV